METKLKNMYNKHFLSAELAISLIIWFFLYLIIRNYLPTVFGTVIIGDIQYMCLYIFWIVAAASLGFISSDLLIINILCKSNQLKLLRESKYYSSVFKIYWSTMRYLVLVIVVCILGLIFRERISILVFYFLLWSVIILPLRIWRCIWIFRNIAEIISQNK